MAILGKEIAALYEAFSQEQESPLPELNVQYQDFSVWQRKQEDAPFLKQQLDFWKQELSHTNVINLPNDFPRPAITHSEGASARFQLGEKTTTALQKLSRENNATLYMTMISLFGLLLYRYSQQSSFYIGTPVAGRANSQLEPMIGCFLNMVAIKTNHIAEDSFTQLLSKNRDTIQTAFANQDIPFEQVVKEVVTDRNLSVTPIFQVMFAMQNMPFEVINKVGDIQLESIEPEKQSALYDLSLNINEWQGEIYAEFDYKTEIFKAETIDALITNFKRLIQSVVDKPEQSIADIELVSDNDRQKQLGQWVQTQVDRQPLPSIHAYFEQQVEQNPKAIALRFNKRHMSYGVLNEKANQIAHLLIENDVKPGDIVGIQLDRSLELPIAILACLKAGAVYLPFDLAYPEERLKYIAEDTQVKLLLSVSNIETWDMPSDLQRINIDDKTLWKDLAKTNPKPRELSSSEDALFNIIYTSGSTGKPKGVMVSHASMINRLLWMQETFALDTSDRVLQKTPYSFDVSVWEFFWPLMNGAELVLAKPKLHKNPGYLVDLINKQEITIMHFVPSMLRVFLQTDDISFCQTLKRVFCSGESLTPDIVDQFYTVFPDVELINLYGPTEAAIDVTYHQCEAGTDIIPIGTPISQTQIYVLDQKQHLLPTGAVGEIYIGGDNLAQGYINQSQLTEQAFISNPFKDKNNPSDKLYRTGDLGKFDANGTLYYLGRTDHQVKIRGLRVELGEIETILAQHDLINNCVVVAKTNAQNDTRILAYFTSKYQDIDPLILRDHLAPQLPTYMIPTSFTQLDDIPLTPSGKIDRQNLPDTERGILNAQTYIAPRDDIERILADVWAELLEIERVGIHDNFFELGGHSLLATVAISRLQKEFNVSIPLTDIFKDPTIANIADAIRKAQQAQKLSIDDNSVLGDDEEEITL